MSNSHSLKQSHRLPQRPSTELQVLTSSASEVSLTLHPAALKWGLFSRLYRLGKSSNNSWFSAKARRKALLYVKSFEAAPRVFQPVLSFTAEPDGSAKEAKRTDRWYSLRGRGQRLWRNCWNSRGVEKQVAKRCEGVVFEPQASCPSAALHLNIFSVPFRSSRILERSAEHTSPLSEYDSSNFTLDSGHFTETSW